MGTEREDARRQIIGPKTHRVTLSRPKYELNEKRSPGGVSPTPYAIVEMERYFENFHLTTQNVDGLHIRAGSKGVLELHGNMWRGRCTRCGTSVDPRETPLRSIPPYCECGNPLPVELFT